MKGGCGRREGTKESGRDVMWEEGTESNWSKLAEGVMLEIKGWRKQHPKATLTEIEAAVDGLWAKARTQLIQDVALASETRAIGHEGGDSCSRCPECGGQLESRGEKVRRLITHQERCIELKRSYGVCLACRAGFFPPG